jgi:hypothetical protein
MMMSPGFDCATHACIKPRLEVSRHSVPGSSLGQGAMVVYNVCSCWAAAVSLHKQLSKESAIGCLLNISSKLGYLWLLSPGPTTDGSLCRMHAMASCSLDQSCLLHSTMPGCTMPGCSHTHTNGFVQTHRTDQATSTSTNRPMHYMGAILRLRQQDPFYYSLSALYSNASTYTTHHSTAQHYCGLQLCIAIQSLCCGSRAAKCKASRHKIGYVLGAVCSCCCRCCWACLRCCFVGDCLRSCCFFCCLRSSSFCSRVSCRHVQQHQVCRQ